MKVKLKCKCGNAKYVSVEGIKQAKSMKRKKTSFMCGECCDREYKELLALFE